MPLFEYRCPSCDHVFEQLVRGREDEVSCPSCREPKPQKLMSAAATPVVRGQSLPLAGSCPPSDAPPCSPHCCRLP